jgi:hypothetical protein
MDKWICGTKMMANYMYLTAWVHWYPWLRMAGWIWVTLGKNRPRWHGIFC